VAIPISNAPTRLAARSATVVPTAMSPSVSASSNRGALSSLCRLSRFSRFWASFRTFRDLAVVGLMLLDGLRSCEILSLQLEDWKLADAQLRVLGKGRKQRTVPLPAEIMEVLQSYLRLERPLTNSPYLFISLKGRRRGQPMTPAGLRSLFRHHRSRSTVLRLIRTDFDTMPRPGLCVLRACQPSSAWLSYGITRHSFFLRLHAGRVIEQLFATKAVELTHQKPLGAHLAPYANVLAQRGYARHSIRNHIVVIAASGARSRTLRTSSVVISWNDGDCPKRRCDITSPSVTNSCLSGFATSP
jgi:hypothetical protein